MSHSSTHHPHAGERGVLARLIGGLARRGRGRTKAGDRHGRPVPVTSAPAPVPVTASPPPTHAVAPAVALAPATVLAPAAALAPATVLAPAAALAPATARATGPLVLDRPAVVPSPAGSAPTAAPNPAATPDPADPVVLVPAWQDWGERRRTETPPTPHREPTRPAGPWAAVRLHDGRTVTVTSTVLLGRAPAARTGETPGALLTVADPQRSVSKTHLAVGVDRGGAWVVDRSSTNGTVVTLPDGSRILCVPERRVRLVPGASVAFGDAALTLTAVARHHATDEESTP